MRKALTIALTLTAALALGGCRGFDQPVGPERVTQKPRHGITEQTATKPLNLSRAQNFENTAPNPKTSAPEPATTPTTVKICTHLVGSSTVAYPGHDFGKSLNTSCCQGHPGPSTLRVARDTLDPQHFVLPGTPWTLNTSCCSGASPQDPQAAPLRGGSQGSSAHSLRSVSLRSTICLNPPDYPRGHIVSLLRALTVL